MPQFTQTEYRFIDNDTSESIVPEKGQLYDVHLTMVQPHDEYDNVLVLIYSVSPVS